MVIQGKSFIVTGGASGLGAATARMLRAAGAAVLIADVADGQPLADEIGAIYHPTDVTEERDGQAAVDVAMKEFGALSGLVNCAGVVIGERVLGRDKPHGLDSFTRVVTVNLVGTFNMIRLAAAAIRQSVAGPDGERGVIVNTASIAAYDGQIGQAAYAASKGGVIGMTLPIARELARDGIRVMTVAPGLFETPMMLGLPADVQDALGRTVPFPPRLGHPSEYAALVRHILENTMLNGEVIRLDGAVRLPPK